MLYPTLFPPQVNSLPTELAAAIDAVQLTITVADGSILPDEPCPLTIGNDVDAETILLTNKSGNTLHVIRGFEGEAKAWPKGEAIARNVTAYDHTALISNVEAVNTAAQTANANAIRIKVNGQAQDPNGDISVSGGAKGGNIVTVLQLDWTVSGTKYLVSITDASIPADTTERGYQVNITWNDESMPNITSWMNTETFDGGGGYFITSGTIPAGSLTGVVVILEVEIT